MSEPNVKVKLTSDQEVQHFDDLSSDYKKEHDKALLFAGGDSDHFYYQKIKLIKERLAKPCSNILDFGCGTGRLAILLAQSFPSSQILGFDPSSNSIDEARQDALQIKNINWASDIVKFQDQNNDMFDFAVAAGVFHHIPAAAWQENLQIIYKKLKPDGKLFVFEHNALSIATRILLAWAGNDKDATLLFPWDIKSCMQASHFNEIRIDYISFFPTFLKPLLGLEKYITWCPLGAQYLCTGVKTG